MLYQELIKYELLYEFKDESGVERGTFITCLQQVYNFKLANAVLCNNRKKSLRSKNKKKAEKVSEDTFDYDHVFEVQSVETDDNIPFFDE